MNNVTVSDWDTAEFLTSKEIIDEYLAVAFASEDPKLISQALGNVAKAYGMNNISNETGIRREQLYRSFSSKGNPTLQSLTKILSSLGYQLTVVPKTTRA